MASYLKDSGALFVTSSIDLAGMLSAHERHVYILGGTLKPGTIDIVGAEALDAIRRYNFTKVFLGTSGVSLSQGFTTPDPEEAMVKGLAAARARETWVLADSSKFGTITAAAVLPLERARIITDRLDDRRYLEYTEIKEV